LRHQATVLVLPDGVFGSSAVQSAPARVQVSRRAARELAIDAAIAGKMPRDADMAAILE